MSDAIFETVRALIADRMNETDHAETRAFYRYLLLTIGIQEQVHADTIAGLDGTAITLCMGKALGNLIASVSGHCLNVHNETNPHMAARDIMHVIDHQIGMCLNDMVTTLATNRSGSSTALH